MLFVRLSDKYRNAERALNVLSRDIATTRIALNHTMPPLPHSGNAYQLAAIRYAETSRAIEYTYAESFLSIAAEITRVADEGWQRKPHILRLWYRLAEIAKNFSDYPTKPTVTLIISTAPDMMGKLICFGFNRIPEGVPLVDVDHSKGQRKDYRVCAERMALAQLHGIAVVPAPPPATNLAVRRENARNAAETLTNSLIELGGKSDLLSNCVLLLTTESPCSPCYRAITPHRPKEIITIAHAGRDFTRAHDMNESSNCLVEMGILRPVKNLAFTAA